MIRLLLVDDDLGFVRTITLSLKAHGYEVIAATSGELALEEAYRQRPDVALVDLGLPSMDGVEVVVALRQWWDIPIIVVTARHDESSKVRTLDLGADDYVTKPFGIEELLARLRATLRRAGIPAEMPRIEMDDLTIDLRERSAMREGETVALTATEWRLLEVLVAGDGRVFSKDELLAEVWGPRGEGAHEYVRVHIAALRRKLEADHAHPRHLFTHTNQGYQFRR